ncbi:MAG: 6-bladed beta-propeller [Akkermansiaceae bacterium]
MKKAIFVSVLLSGLVAQAHEGHKQPPAGKVVTSAQMTGNGAFRFETVPGFGVMPNHVNVGPTHGGVAVDGKGNVYVSTEAGHGVVKFSPDGKFLKGFGPNTKALHSLAVVSEGKKEVLIGAAVSAQKILKLDLDGKLLMVIPNDNTGVISGGLKGVTAVDVGPDGNIYVACGYGSNLIHKFDATGKLIKTAGGRGTGDGKFVTCHGLAIDSRSGKPLLLICDRENRRMVHFDLELNFIAVHTKNLRRPCAVSIRGDFAAVAELEGRVTILGKKGECLAFLGDQPDRSLWAKKPVPQEKLFDGLFTAPHGLSWDHDGNLIVQDWNVTGRVTKLKKL